MEEDGNEIVTLVLKNQRFRVNKRKLTNKSEYFATLILSKNFKDHSLSEYGINYDISVISFQDFINWIHSDEMTERNVIINEIGNSVEIENNVERLLSLLDLSVLFIVKDELKLKETIIDILQNCNLTPEDALDAWLMAQKLNCKMLRDLSFSVCLDRFTELPINLICELSKENFLQLIENTNLRIPKNLTTDAKAYLSRIAQEWIKVNKEEIPLDNLEKTGPKVYQSIISYNFHNYYIKNEFNLYCWNGDKSFELATFKSPVDLINNQNRIEEMNIIARGGLSFWHGSFWQELNSLDIYDVHKGTWTQGMDMPFKYNNLSDCCNVDKHLICFSHYDVGFIYIYNSEINYWCKIAIIYEHKLHQHDLHMTAQIIKQFKNASCNVDMQDRVNLKSIICDNSEYKQKFYKEYAKYLQVEEKYKDESNFDMYFYFRRNGNHMYNDMYDYFLLFCSKNKNVEYKLIHLKRERLPWHSVPIQNLKTYQSISLNICSTVFSNLMDPADLYAN